MGKKLKGLIAGLALGGLMGILFAPKKGKDLRENIKKDITEGNYGVNALKNAFVAMGKDVGDFTGEVAKNKDVKEYLAKGEKAAKNVKKKASVWLEKKYGITEADLKKVKKQLKKKVK